MFVKMFELVKSVRKFRISPSVFLLNFLFNIFFFLFSHRTIMRQDIWNCTLIVFDPWFSVCLVLIRSVSVAVAVAAKSDNIIYEEQIHSPDSIRLHRGR